MTDDEITNLMDSISSAKDTDGASAYNFDGDDDAGVPDFIWPEDDLWLIIIIVRCIQVKCKFQSHQSRNNSQ